MYDINNQSIKRVENLFEIIINNMKRLTNFIIFDTLQEVTQNSTNSDIRR